MRILSIDGGGYLGLATAAFIKETERHFNTSYHENFDMFCGTSTGAIIALGLASGMSGEEIVDKYEELGKNVFYNPFWGCRLLRSVRSLVFTKYSNKHLKIALKNTFQDQTLGDIHAKQKSALITAFSVTKGTPRIFKTDHSSDLTSDNNYLLCDIALASSAAPTYLPLAKLNSPTSGVEETFCDGGLFANHPALLGYAEAVSHLGIPAEKVSVLSLSTPRTDLAEWASTENFLRRYLLSRGLVFWRSKILSVMIDSTSTVAHQTLRRLLSWDEQNARYIRIQLNKPNGVEMDITTNKATIALKQIGSSAATNNINRNQISKFLNSKGENHYG